MSARRSRLVWVLVVLATVAASAGIAAGVWFGILHRGATTQIPLPLRLHGHAVVLESPRWLLMAAILPYLALVRRASLTDLSAAQQWLSASVRGLAIMGVALALSRPTLVLLQHHVCEVLLVDVSASVPDSALHDAQTYVQSAWQGRGDNDVLVVRFAGRAEAVPPPAKPNDPFSAVGRFDDPAVENATDLERALELAEGLYPAGSIRRAVLLSDGLETSGDAIAEAQKAASLGLRIDTVAFASDVDPEISLRALHLPDTIQPEAPFLATAEVWSNESASATITLYQDGFLNGLQPTQTVSLTPGRNDVPFRTVVHDGGAVTYRAELTTAAPDRFKDNNRVVATALVRGQPRVLYVEGEPDYSGDLARALKAQDIDVEVRGPDGVPQSERDLAPYDLLLLSDVPVAYVGPDQMSAIDGYVRDLGGGFIMAGGDQSFGSGGYSGTTIEKLLPVTFADQKKEQEARLALILVIDRSGSMGTGSGGATKIELAKEAAKSTAEILDPDDLLGVVAFDTLPTVVVRLQSASNRMAIEEDISRLNAGGGTAILPAMQEAFQELSTAHAKVKHVILLTDGQSDTGGLLDLIQEMASPADKITVSTVGVGDDADRDLLATIAQTGQGKFYFTRDPASIPRIFTDDATEVARSSIVEDQIGVKVANSEPIVAGLGLDTAPPLRGYVSTQAKAGADVVLLTSTDEPLLARWQRGLGQAVVWTSDVKARWSADWIAWEGFQRFWAQVVRATMRHGVDETFDLRAQITDGSTAHVVVDAIGADDRFVNGLTTDVTVLDPDRQGWTAHASLVQTAAGRYEGDVTLPRYGSYLLRATHRDDSGAVVAESQGAVSLPYPAELRTAPADTDLLARLRELTGGLDTPTVAQMLDPGDLSQPYRHELWPWVVLAMAALYVLDVALRRVRLFGYRPLTL
jgi:uncharacterized membrane protein